jgi:glutathione S-transferase
MRKWTAWMQGWSAQSGERARVPVLQYWDESGEEHIMPESNEIDLFLDQCDGDPQFTPVEGSVEYAEMEKWWRWCDDEMKPMIDLYKYGKNREWNREDNEVYMHKLGAYISVLEVHLKGHTYLVDERLTLADVAVIPFIRQIMRTRDGEFDLKPFPHVLAWANTILETEWFQNDVMKKYPLAPVGNNTPVT